jgi:hypothetical protein
MIRNNYLRRKLISFPLPSEKLAEFIGIFLGDGSFRNRYQIAISYNYKNEVPYARYIENLTIEFFGLKTKRPVREKYGSADIIATSSNLVDFLSGTLRLNDIREKDKFILPKWIKKYKIGYIRGLFDSEGCVYRHRYISNKKYYTYIKIAITNYLSRVLVLSKKLLHDSGFHPVIYHNRIHLYNQREVNSFLELIGTNNNKNRLRLKEFIS